MSGGVACVCEGSRAERVRHWRVVTYRANFSAFNGYRRTPSAYSEVRCAQCGERWRTKATYVERLMERQWWDESRGPR